MTTVPLRPIPTTRQVEWHDAEIGMFFHWDISVSCWTPDGLIPERDMDMYGRVGKAIKDRFGNPLGKVSGEGDVVTIRFPKVTEINQMSVREDIAKGGERIAAYMVEGRLADGSWKPLCAGTVVGHRRVDLFEKAQVSEVRLKVLQSWDKPLIRDFEVFNMSDWRPVIV